jgi:hypothetical protein
MQRPEKASKFFLKEYVVYCLFLAGIWYYGVYCGVVKRTID